MNHDSIKTILDASSSLLFAERYLDPARAINLFSECLADIPWEQSQIAMFGKRVAIPRLNAWYGEHPYTYSGTTFPARPLTPELQNLKNGIEEEFGLKLNSVLANLYRDGSDSMGWHSDDEKMLGEYPQIASVSLGESRRFLVRNKTDKAKKTEIALSDGSLLIMQGRCQNDWEHCVPKTAKRKKPRVNLTFRLCEPQAYIQKPRLSKYHAW